MKELWTYPTAGATEQTKGGLSHENYDEKKAALHKLQWHPCRRPLVMRSFLLSMAKKFVRCYILPEKPDLKLLFFGKAPAPESVEIGHYFQGVQGRSLRKNLATNDRFCGRFIA